jgi:polyisoprenoid-binding protein YceI
MPRNRNGLVVLTGHPHQTRSGVYIVDPTLSTVGFFVPHAMVANVRGKFTAFEGLLKLDGSNRTPSEAYLSVQTGSLETGMPDRDAHLTGPELLDSATFPLMAFRSVAIIGTGDDVFRMSGYLRIKDVELPLHVALEFRGAARDALGRDSVGFEGSATLRRSDWGLDRSSLSDMGGVLISDKVKLLLDITAVRPLRT